MYNSTISTRTMKNGAQWTVRKGYESITDKINLDDFGSGTNGKQYNLIKENRVRSVISMPGSDISENGIYIKYFKRGGYCDYVKYLFVPTRIRTEWEVGNALLNKNINTALPLAMAKKRTYSLLVTEAVTNSEEFMGFCQDRYQGTLSGEKEAEKKKLLRKLVYFMRNIHEKGVCHYDLHAGNILVKFKNNQSPSIHDCDLYLMDLHRVKILNKMSCRKRRYNIAQIFNSLSSILTKTDKLDFLRSYGVNVLGSATDENELIGQIESQSSRIRNIHYRSRRKRCLKESSVFSKKRSIGMKTFFRRKGYDANRFAGLIEKHHNALVNGDKAIVMKRDSKTALTRLPLKVKKIQSVVVKQYKVSCGMCLIKNIFRNSAGKKAWIAGNGLLVYGFNTPEPLALMEKKVLGITTDSYLIMEDARDCLEMDRYILKSFHDKLSLSKLKKKRALINNLAETMGRMHNRNIFHHDLKTCNIMVKEEGKSFYFTFLDFDKVSFEEEINIRKRVKNLTQINLSTPKLISTTDRLRFLKEYLKQCNIMDKKKNILREIIKLSKTEKILYVSSNGDITEDW